MPMGRRGGITVHMSFAEAIFDGLGVKPFLWGIYTLQHMMNDELRLYASRQYAQLTSAP